MPKKKRRFIDPKKAIKFVVVPRSSSDILASDVDAPTHTLSRVEGKYDKQPWDGQIEELEELFESEDEGHEYIVDISDDKVMEGVLVPESEASFNKRKFVKPQYDYSKHMKPTGVSGSVFISKDGKVTRVGEPDTPNYSKGLNLDPQLFPWISKDAEDEAAHYKRMELFKADEIVDPEIDDLLNRSDDEDLFNDDNALDDDFVLKANADEDGYCETPVMDDEFDDYHDDEDFEDVGVDSDVEEDFAKLSIDEKPKPSETIYKNLDKDIMIVPGRPVHSLLMEEKFEVTLQRYEETMDMIDDDPKTLGSYEPDIFEGIIDEFLNSTKKTQESVLAEIYTPSMAPRIEKTFTEDDLVSGSEEDSEDEELIEIIYGKEKNLDPEWDCETILSTYTNTENHPTVIDMYPTRRREGVKPIKKSEPVEELSDIEQEKQNRGVPRQKKESTEEKRERKKAVKEQKKESRQNKKACRLKYRQEEIKKNKSRKGTHGVSIIPM